jgi:hypothetical protein
MLFSMRPAFQAALAALALGAVPVAGQQPATVDPQSLMTTPVLLFNGAREVSQGTGFFYGNQKSDGTFDTVFLVTNYHVVTGHAPRVSTTRSGDRIRFALHENPDDLEKVRSIELALYDQRGDPIWVSSDSFPNADVVLVPLPAKVYAGIPQYVFTEMHTKADIKIRPTSGATLLGYPYGFYDKKHLLPVWKTGHVASEPDVDFEGEPTFLVDVSAFPGMSGSPVLAVATGIYETEDAVMRSGRVLKLLGIFSAMPVIRQTRPDPSGFSSEAVSTETSLQLGYVWKASLIAEIARNYRSKSPAP